MLVRFLEASREQRRLDGEHRDRKSIKYGRISCRSKAWVARPQLVREQSTRARRAGIEPSQRSDHATPRGMARFSFQSDALSLAPEVAAEIEQENETRNERKTIRVN